MQHANYTKYKFAFFTFCGILSYMSGANTFDNLIVLKRRLVSGICNLNELQDRQTDVQQSFGKTRCPMWFTSNFLGFLFFPMSILIKICLSMSEIDPTKALFIFA